MNEAVSTRTVDVLADSIARLEREAALRERLSALGRLNTVIAHELRNPLMIIRAAVRSLEQEDASGEEVRDLAFDIDRQVARLGRVVRDVLDFARPLRVEPAPVDVAALVWDAAGAVLGAGEKPHLRLALEPGVGTIVTDADRLRGVLANLVLNARDGVRAAGRTGGEDVEIGGRRLGGGRLLLWVEDRGAGVATEDLPHVFEPFFTTKSKGTGLGLARKVVEALGGSIRMESREGEGTRVEIELPVNAAVTRVA